MALNCPSAFHLHLNRSFSSHTQPASRHSLHGCHKIEGAVRPRLSADFSWRCSQLLNGGHFLHSRSVHQSQPYTRGVTGSRCKLNTSGTAEPDNGGKDSGRSERIGASHWTNASGSPGNEASGNVRNAGEEESSYRVPSWDLAARRKRLQEAASRMGDPFRGMVTTASRKLQDYFDNHKGTKVKGEEDGEGDESVETDWHKWQKVFAEVEEKYALLEALQFQLDEAIDQEDYKEAARLKDAFDGCAAGDPMATSLAELERALTDERYEDAAQIRDQTGADLIGWWSGLGEGTEDPYGRIVNITPMQGRLIARSYTAKHLAAAREGRPLFEIFVARDEDGNYRNQAVYLRRRDGVVRAIVPDAEVEGKDASEVKVEETIPEEEGEGEGGEGKGKEGSGEEEDRESAGEGLRKIMSFLKDKMPGLKGQVIQVINPSDLGGDTQSMVEQLLRKMAEAAGEGGGEGSGLGKSGAKTGGEDRVGSRPGGGPTGRLGAAEGNGRDVGVDKGGREDGGESSDAENLDVRVSVRVEMADIAEASGGLKGGRIPRPPERVPARIEKKSRDLFAFHIEGQNECDALSALKDVGEGGWKMSATVMVNGEAGTLPTELTSKKSWDMGNLPMKPEHVDRLMRLAVLQAQRSGLSKTTSFRRINVDDANADPLSGLYIGAFGPYTSEVVQLRRKFGRWEGDESDTPYEYVEAVKLTGDLNVPAGQVTFRSKIGRHQRLSYQGVYPEELGVTARYKGQGRLAEQGFKNPRWIDGELVLLDGKTGGKTNGADLGFVYSVPERHFLVLFNRLKLRNN